jgi:hypothetical protein
MDSEAQGPNNFDWLALVNDPHLQEFFVRHTLRAIKTNERPWGAFDVAILRPDGAALQIPRAWGFAFSADQAALCSLYVLGSEPIINEALIHFLGEQIINDLIKVVDVVKQSLEPKSQ